MAIERLNSPATSRNQGQGPDAGSSDAVGVVAHGESRWFSYGIALSIALHLLVLAVLLWAPLHNGGSRAAKRGVRRPLMIITLAAPPTIPQAVATAVTPPQALPEPKPRPEDAATPSRPAKPKSAQSKPAQPSKAAAVSDAGEEQARIETDPAAEADALLQGLRDRWLQPPHTTRDFHCRIRIDYQPGGMISSVKVQEGCGAVSLDDSVERAVWKLQPLPLSAARTQAGSLLLDFSP